MGLWIRSQDKEMLKKIYTALYLKQGLSNYAKGEVIFIVGSGDELGEYETKERALEVLDEIQKLLMPIIEYKQEVDTLTINYKNIDTVIYEMPQE